MLIGSCFVFFISLDSLAYCFGFNVFSTHPPHPQPSTPQFFSFQIWILCQIRGVGFVLKKLFTLSEMLIYHMPTCTLCKWSLFVFYWQSGVNCFGLSVRYLQMSIRNLKEWRYINYMCFEVHQALKKAHAAFDQGRGFERGRGGNLPSPLMAFFNIHIIDIFTTYWHFTCRGTLDLRPFIAESLHLYFCRHKALFCIIIIIIIIILKNLHIKR